MGKYDKAEKAAMAQQPRKSRNELELEQLRKRFMKLPDDEKNLIREAKAAGLEWKGEKTHPKMKQLDGLSHFEHVFREWKQMKEIGVEAYRKKSLAGLYRYTKGSLGSIQR